MGFDQDSTTNINDYNIVIDSIEISGNDITEDFIILRELTFGVGDTLNSEIAGYNRERIYSLGIFNDVRLKPYQVGQVDILKIEIDESWYIYPLPFVQLTDKDWDKITYGVGLLWKNFRGRNETLRGRISFGYDPSYSFAYINPNLSYNLNLYHQSQFVFTKAENRSSTAEQLYGSNFNQDFYSGRLTFGKRFGLFHRFSINGGFDYIETPFYIQGINASDERIDRTVILGATYSYDTRDLVQFPTNGIYASANFELKGMGINNIRYRVANIDFREYRTFFQKLTTKWRFSARHTGGSLVPYYDYSFLGFSERIRGYFYGEEREGNDLLYTSVEFDYPIIEETRIDLYFVPLLPRSLLSYRVALYSSIFADTGTTRMDGEPLKIKNFDTGYGTGLSLLLLPYMILRFEFAINDHGQTEWIFDLGSSF
ncbi:MAG TPA: BamA/TamA family outer membrane protein [Ignavibacteriaceae bacterium]